MTPVILVQTKILLNGSTVPSVVLTILEPTSGAVSYLPGEVDLTGDPLVDQFEDLANGAGLTLANLSYS